MPPQMRRHKNYRNMDKKLAVMVDLSRNSVMTTDALKRFIAILKQFHYNVLMLYIEDTYEIEGEEYFGYMRGRYTRQELKEIDDFCYAEGIEVIPCIQTLAHLNQIVRWYEDKNMFDVNDILLVGEEKTYTLIEKMIKTMRACFRTGRIHIGMDEAHLLGKGKYFDIHGYRKTEDIFAEHLKRVVSVCKENMFKPMIWSDMPFCMSNKQRFYYADTKNLKKEAIDLIPEDVELVYWDYSSEEKAHYDNMISGHQKFPCDFWTAGAAWTFAGIAPHNSWSLRAEKAFLDSMESYGVTKHIMTVWHDGGGECPELSVLPSLCFAGEYFFGNKEIEKIKKKFAKVTGIPFDEFLYLDLPDVIDVELNEMTNQNPSKYLLYNDCFLGLYDSTVPEGTAEKCEANAKKLEKHINHKEYGYLFAWAKALCDLTAVKCDIGIRLRKAYKEKNIPSLEDCIQRMERIVVLTQNYYDKFKDVWFRSYKPFGFELQDARIGGVIHRVKHCIERTKQYIEGKIPCIEELDATQYDVFGGKEKFGKKIGAQWDYKRIITTGNTIF